MYNLLIAIGAGLAFFALGAGVANNPWAGVPVGIPAMILIYIVLARRSGKRLEAIFGRATKEFEQGRMDSGRRILEEGFVLNKWQFLVDGQIHAQLGAIDYLKQDWKSARRHLEKAWARNWQAQAMLAAIDHRQGEHGAALKRLEKTKGPGAKDPVFWALYGYVALKSGDQDQAIRVLNEGLQKLPDNEPLKGMSNKIRNGRKLKMKPFAPGWYQFFPEDIPRQAMMGAQPAANRGKGYPMPRR